MRFFYTNLIDATGVSFSASSSASSSLGPSNVAHEFKTKVWRTGTSSATEYVTIDLGSAQAATALILFAHTLTGADGTLQLRGSTDNFAASDVLVASLTYAASVISSTFSTATYRYWRVKFTKSAAGESRDIGRIFLGNYTDSADPTWDGVKIEPLDLTIQNRTAGGQVYSDQRSQYRKIKTQLSGLTTTEKNTLKTISENVGTFKSFFVQIKTTLTGELVEVLYVKLKAAVARDASGVASDGDVAFDATVEFEEQL